jgi:deoxycytidylate deaminase
LYPCQYIMKNTIQDTLFKLAQSVEPVRGARIAAAVVLRGKVVAYGYNHMKTHPFQTKYAKNEHAIFFHAETHAIKNALRSIEVDELSKCELYIMRARYNANHKWEFGMSLPCEGCKKCIEEFGIKQVYYTVNGSGIKTYH